MGICKLFSQQAENQIQHPIATLSLKSGSKFNRINFTFTNTSLNQLKGDCLVFYLDHVSELSQTQLLSKLKPNIRRKMLQYLKVAEQQTEKNSASHCLIPLAVPSLRFNYLLFVKIQPWDGVSLEQIQKKIYNLTTSYFQVFSLRKIKKLTIVEFDLCLGIHYSVGCHMIAKAIEKYCWDIKSVNMLCNTFETVRFSFMYFKNYGAGNETLESKKNNDPKDKRKIRGENYEMRYFVEKGRNQKLTIQRN